MVAPPALRGVVQSMDSTRDQNVYVLLAGKETTVIKVKKYNMLISKNDRLEKVNLAQHSICAVFGIPRDCSTLSRSSSGILYTQ